MSGKWRVVTHADHVGTVDNDRFSGFTRQIFMCALECGHSAMVTVAAPPKRLDCMRCAGPMFQLALPMAMPRAARPPEKPEVFVAFERHGQTEGDDYGV